MLLSNVSKTLGEDALGKGYTAVSLSLILAIAISREMGVQEIELEVLGQRMSTSLAA